MIQYMLIINVNYIVFHMYSNNATTGYACVFLYKKWAHLSDVARFREVLINEDKIMSSNGWD